MKTPLRFHQPERHSLHHSFHDFCAAIDREAPDDELLDILEKATHPVEQIEEGIRRCNYPKSLPDDIQADVCAGIASQDFQDKLKTSIQKANALLLTNTHTNENNGRIPQEETIESQTNLTIGSTYDIPVLTNSSKTTARSDTHINDIYQTFERQLDGIPIEGFSTIKSNESTTSIAEITKSLHILNSTSDRPKRRGRRPGAAALRA